MNSVKLKPAVEGMWCSGLSSNIRSSEFFFFGRWGLVLFPGWLDLYINPCPLIRFVVFARIHPTFSLVHSLFLSAHTLTFRHSLSPVYALFSYDNTISVNLAVLTFWSDTEYKAYFGIFLVEPNKYSSHHSSTPLTSKIPGGHGSSKHESH